MLHEGNEYDANNGTEVDECDAEKTVSPDWKRIKEKINILWYRGAEWSNAQIKSFYNYDSEGDKADTEKTVPQTERESKRK